MQAQLVKKLRSLTGSTIIHCKKALEECNNDIESAQDWLRLKGVSQAHKKIHNTTGAGLISGILTPNAGYLLEVLCETDFVAKTDLFQTFSREVLTAWSKSSLGYSEINNLQLEFFKKGLEESRLETIAKTQENLIIRRGEKYEVGANTAVGVYLHNSIGNLLGLSGCLLKITGEKPLDQHRQAVNDLAHRLCMQVVAGKPLFLDKKNIPQGFIEKETISIKEALDDNLKNKPKHVLDGIVKGKVDKSLDQVTLNEQVFVISEDPEEKPVKTIIKDLGLAISNNLHIESYSFFACEAFSK